MKRQLGEVWKENGFWKVQGAKLINGYKTKRDAVKISESIKNKQ